MLTSTASPSSIGMVHSLELSQDPKCMQVNLLKHYITNLYKCIYTNLMSEQWAVVMV